MTASCLYVGTVRHRRVAPAREFRHRLGFAYVDLDELPGLLGGRLLGRRPGHLRFRRRDYLGDPAQPLRSAVQHRIAELGGDPPDGPVRLLTQLRSWGICFNPVSFYYCLDRDAIRVEAVLAEVTNTPWGERHSYLLCGSGGILRGTFAKQLHVSPFMGMDHVYEASATPPGQTLSVHIESMQEGIRVFDATLKLERRELTRATAARFPFASARVLALIYGHALGLKIAGAHLHAHPRTQT